MNQLQEDDELLRDVMDGVLLTEWDAEMANAKALKWSLAALEISLLQGLGDRQDEILDREYEEEQPVLDTTWMNELAQVFRAIATVVAQQKKSLREITQSKESLGIPKPSEIVVEECIRDIIRTTVESYAENFHKKIKGLVPWALRKLSQIPEDIDDMPSGEYNDEFPEAEHYHAIFDESGGDINDDDHVINALIKEITEICDDQTMLLMPELLEQKLFTQ